MNVFELAAKITLDKSEYESGLDGALGKAQSFASSIGSGLVTACKVGATAIAAIGTASIALGKALFDNANATAEFGDHVDKMSQKIGISTQAYQEWSYVMNLCGADVDQLQVGMKTLSGVITDAAGGTDSAIQKIEALGLSVEDLNGLSQEQQLDVVITALQSMESSAERTAIATDLLGRSATDLAPLLNLTAEETANLKNEAEEYGMIMSEEAVKASANFKDSLTRLTGAFNGAKNSIMGQFLPAITSITDGLAMLISGQDGAREAIESGINDVVAGFSEALPNIIDAITMVGGMILESAPMLIDSLNTGILQALPMLLDLIMNTIIPTVINSAIAMYPQIMDTGLNLLISFMDGIVEALPDLIVTISDLILMISEKLTEPAMLQKIIESAIMIMIALGEGIIRSIPTLLTALGQVTINILSTLGNLLEPVLELGKDIVIKLKNGISNKINTIKTAVSTFVSDILSWFAGLPTSLLDVGRNIIVGLWNGINDKVNWIKQKITGFADSVLSAIKNFFGIASPSKEFKKIGGFMAEGLGIGWSDEYADVQKDIENSLEGMDLNMSAKSEFTPSGASEEMALMREQNELLRQLLEKDYGITDDDIFRSVRRSATIYKRSTGDLAFQ